MPTKRQRHVASRALDASDAPARRPLRRHPVLHRHNRHHEVALSPPRFGRHQPGGSIWSTSKPSWLPVRVRWESRSGAGSASRPSTRRAKACRFTPGARRFVDAGSWDVTAVAAPCARQAASTSSAPIPSSPAIRSRSKWPIRTGSVRAATTRRPACTPTRGPGRSRWSRSTEAHSTAPSRSRSSMCRRSCAGSPEPTSP